MRKLILSAVAVAVVAGSASMAYVSGVFQKDIAVSFATPEVDMPKLLLLPATNKECQRRRLLDGQGGATDNIDLIDGYTRVVVYDKLPIIRSETTYYPAGDYKNCDSFAKDDPRQYSSAHGQVFTQIERDASGFKPVRERKFYPDGKLMTAGNLVANGEKFQTDYIGMNGLTTRSETYNLTSKSVESETLYRPDGTALLRQALKPTETSFTKEHFSADGKYVDWKEYRSYGNYAITAMYPNGKERYRASRGVGYSYLMKLRTDGTNEMQLQLWSDRSISIDIYDAAGNTTLQTRWKESKSGPVDSNGYRPLILWKVQEMNAKGRPVRSFDFRPDGSIELVTLNKDGEYFKGKTEFSTDLNGVAVTAKSWNDEGKENPLTTFTSNAPQFTAPQAYFVQPQFELPAGLDKYDDKIATEISHHPGGM